MRRAVTIIFVLLGVVLLGGGFWLYTPDKPRSVLEATYAAPPSAFVEIAGIRLHLRDTGPRDAPAIIMLHGFGASLHTWEDWAALLEPNYRVIRMDLPGFGLTGTDPTGEGMGRPTPSKGRARTSREKQQRAARSARPAGSVRSAPTPSSKSTAGVSGRDMPTAVAVGALMSAVFVGAIIWKPQAVLAIVVVIIGLAAVEYFEKVTEKGYQPATVVGIVACIAAPIAAYWVGERAVPLVLIFAFIAGSITFIGAQGLSSSPMPNMAITTLGVSWIGLAGAYGGLILGAQSSGLIPGHAGTDTLLLLAVGVVVNDIGALFVGSAAGRTPLRGWISPNKSVEGFIGGALLTIIAMVVIGIAGKSDTWSNPNLVLLGVVIAIMAPLGDLTESMFKRNLDVKDFGSIVKGHGGILDRFDGFLFTLPAVFYLMMVLEPWVSAASK